MPWPVARKAVVNTDASYGWCVFIVAHVTEARNAVRGTSKKRYRWDYLGKVALSVRRLSAWHSSGKIVMTTLI